MGVPFNLGVPIIRIIVFGGLFGGLGFRETSIQVPYVPSEGVEQPSGFGLGFRR